MTFVPNDSRHWLELMKVVQRKIPIPDKDAEFKLGVFLEFRLCDYSSAVEKILTRAEIEAREEDTLERIVGDWQRKEVPVKFFMDTDVPLLYLGHDELQRLNDDVVSLSTLLQRSTGAPVGTNVEPIVSFHQKRGQELKDTLQQASDVLRLLATCQDLWSMLLPLFDTDEIRQDLPLDSKSFRESDSTLRFLLNRLQKMKYVLKIAKETGVTSKLASLIERLEGCKKGIWWACMLRFLDF